MATADDIKTAENQAEMGNTVVDDGAQLGVRRYFTIPGRDPFDEVEWETRDAFIPGKDKTVFDQKGVEYRPPHLSKDQDIQLGPGDRIRVSTPGGGGFGDPFKRDPAKVAKDVARGYYTAAQVEKLYRVKTAASGELDPAGTAKLRAG